MSELTDDQLDGLFRKSAEEFDPPFDPVAWRDMKTRLDTNDRTVSGTAQIWKKLLRWGLPIGLLLLLSGGGWYAYRRTYPVNTKANARTITKARPPLGRGEKQPSPTTLTPTSGNEPVQTTTVGLKESETKGVQQSTEIQASVAERIRSENRTSEPPVESPKNKVSELEVATKPLSSAYRVKNAGTERRRIDRSRLVGTKGITANPNRSATKANDWLSRTDTRSISKARKQRKIALDENKELVVAPAYPTGSALSLRKRRRTAAQKVTPVNEIETNRSPRLISSAGASNATASTEIGPVALPTLAELPSRPGKWPRLSAFSSREVIAKPDTTAGSVVPKAASNRGLSVRFVAAPDLSSVGLKNFSRPGTNIGLLLEYRLSARWSVQAGVIQSTKVYRALPDEYNTVPTGAWGGPTKPLSVDGRCNMLDIPLNLRYDIRMKTQRNGQLERRWFVSGGVTSYIMEQENYVYNYPPHTYGQNVDANVSTGGYGLSNLNLSVGYERAFSKRLSWQVEPFAKVPLRGVGFFKIDLLSTGALLSIKYKLFK